MTASSPHPDYRFEIALSFAGPHRDKIRAVAEGLSHALDPGLTDRSKGRVFFDEWFEHEILGSDMDALLQTIYHDESLMVVADASQEYADRPWTQAEWKAIRALRTKLDTARDQTARLRLLNVRFNTGEVPGVYAEIDGLLDGNKPVTEIVALILKRHALLRERLGLPSLPSVLPPRAESASAVEPPPKSWVWRSSLESRAADQVSVWAICETVLAVILYWWIAIRFDTSLHLVSSVVIAPLLLLRSPESIKDGVVWFFADHCPREQWPRIRGITWRTAIVAICAIPSCWLANILRRQKISENQNWSLLDWGIVSQLFVLPFVAAFFVATCILVLGGKLFCSGLF